MSAHSDNGDAGSSFAGIDRRFKLSRACDRCRRRRIKCDEGLPCKSCQTSRSPCTFDELGKKSLPHKSKRSTLEERMQQMESFISALPSGFFNMADQPSDGNPILGTPPILTTMTGSTTPSMTPRLVNPGRFFTPLSVSLSGSSRGCEDATLNHPYHVSPVPLASSYLYLDDQGSTRWQGEMSGFPLLDVLIERERGGESPESAQQSSPTLATSEDETNSTAPEDWFPNRQRTRDPVRPEDVWMTISAILPSDLMDHLVILFLKTTYYLMPFLHVPSFVADYQNPAKWDSSFGSFVVAICCLTSRHVDDIRVRADPRDALSAGASYFDLFLRLRSFPGGDRPTLYTVQAVLLAAIYSIGRGKLSKGLALLSEAITLCLDSGLHRSIEQYDHFDPIEIEVRKRTFWCVYAWDKQAAVYFGRPPLIRLRDCDVPEPAVVEDDCITKDGIAPQPPSKTPLMGAFVATNRLYVVIESILDTHPPLSKQSDFLRTATSALSGFRQSKDLHEAEALVEEWVKVLPPYWAVTGETMASRDVIRITQAERLHCLEHFCRMLIHRYRFAIHINHPSPGNEQAKELAMKGAQRTALQIIAKHLEISSLGLMTYYGLFVIHQLTQAGRTLLAILLDRKDNSALTSSSLEALKACVGLLRRFSGRYVCGLRSADLLEETCRLNSIPLEVLEQPGPTHYRPAWLRPVRKRVSSRPPASDRELSPSAQLDRSSLLNGRFDNTTVAKPAIPQSLPASGMDFMFLQGFHPQLLPMTGGGGLVEPFTQGSLAPFTADLFGNDEMGDLLAYLGGDSTEAPSMSYSSSPSAFGGDITMGSTSMVKTSSATPPILS